MIRFIITKTFFMMLLFFGVSSMMTAADKLPERSEIADKYKWNMKDIYPSKEAWNSEFNDVTNEIPKINGFSGKLGLSADNLYKCIDFITNLDKRQNKLYIYASLAQDSKLDDESFQTMYGKIQKLNSDFYSTMSFLIPELLSIPKEKFDVFLKDKNLSFYKHKLEAMYSMKEHTLNASEENLIAKLSLIKSVPINAYSILNDSEMPFPSVKTADGKEVQVSQGRYRSGMYELDRNYRKDVYQATYEPYNMLKGTFAVLFNGRVNSRLIDADIHKFDNPIQASLFPNNIPENVYYNLIETVNKNLKTQHRWGNIKKKALKIDEIHPYDTYVTLFPGTQKSYTYEQAVEICKKALAPLGEEYVKAMTHGFENRWIDVYETNNKRSGAYSNSSGSGPHPFILLNWNNTLDDVFTLVHELGHNMHSYFTEKNQSYQYVDYSTFVAEVASITNEALLLDYLIKIAQTKEEKMALLEKFLTQAQTTFWRQAQFAEYEMIVHQKTQKGETFTSDKLTSLFAELYQKYWGPEMKTDYEEGLSWARIPHFMNYNFYVFQYSTGFAAAQALSEQIIKEGKPAIDRYLTFLSSGSSDYPINILKKAGVDMSSPDPINKTIDKINRYLDELEKMMKE
jgi:oligoendopeptidase F